MWELSDPSLFSETAVHAWTNPFPWRAALDEELLRRATCQGPMSSESLSGGVGAPRYPVTLVTPAWEAALQVLNASSLAYLQGQEVSLTQRSLVVTLGAHPSAHGCALHRRSLQSLHWYYSGLGPLVTTS